MKDFSITYWPASFSATALISSLVVLLGFSLLFLEYAMPVNLLLYFTLTLIIFWTGLRYFTIKWHQLSWRQFESKLWIYSFLFRLLYIGLMYYLTYTLQPESWPFEIEAADSWTYQEAAEMLMPAQFSDYSDLLSGIMKSTADYGFPVFLSLIFKIFGTSTFPVRLIFCFLSTYTVILVARITAHLFSSTHGKLSGILCMLMPTLLYYCGIQVKETLMIFMIVMIVYQSVKIQKFRSRLPIRISTIIILSLLLFYFRTSLAACVLLSIVVYFGLNSLTLKKTFTIFVLALFIIITNYLVVSSGFDQEMASDYDRTEGFYSSYMNDKISRVDNIDVKNVSIMPLMFATSLITPFPSLLYTEQRQLATIQHAPNEFVRMILFYFILLGFVILVRKHFRNASIFLIFIISYLSILTLTGTSMSDRYQAPMIPFFIICFSVGLINSKIKWVRGWSYYLAAMILIVIAWNLFKLEIRGLGVI